MMSGKASSKTTGTNEKEDTYKTTEGSRTEQLVLEDDAVQKIMEDVLSKAGGLADIFGGEQTAGLFDSSVSAQAAGDLAANLAGEIAKITGRTEILSQEDAETKRRRKMRETEHSAEFEGTYGGGG